MLLPEETNVLQISAENLGISPDEVVVITKTWGFPILAVIVEALRNGLGVGFVMTIITQFGPALLQLVVNLFKKKKMLGAAPEDMDGLLWETIIEQYEPQIRKLNDPRQNPTI